MTSTDREGGSVLRGIAYGLTAALAWAIYNAGAKLGTAEGYRALDLAMLRFAVSGVVMLPVALRVGFPPIGLWRNLVLAMSAGPMFALLVNAGFTLAPLSHGVVFGPAASLVSTMLFALVLDKEYPNGAQIAGSVILASGLVVIALDGAHATGGSNVALGDLCFIGAGTFWGAFTSLLKRWGVHPVQGAAAVATLSAIAFVPIYFLAGGRLTFGIASIGAQGFYQGILGGCVGVLAYAATVTQLGAGKAALFPAVVPALAVLLAIPMLKELPTAPELVGIALCTLGLITALGIFTPLRRRYA